MELQSAAGDSAASPGWFDAALHWISLVIEATGVAVIVLGGVAAILVFLLRLARGGEWSGTYHDGGRGGDIFRFQGPSCPG